MINEAVYCLMEGVGDRESIDTVMRLGHEPSDGPAPAGRPDRPRHVPRDHGGAARRPRRSTSTGRARCCAATSRPAGWGASRAAGSMNTADPDWFEELLRRGLPAVRGRPLPARGDGRRGRVPHRGARPGAGNARARPGVRPRPPQRRAGPARLPRDRRRPERTLAGAGGCAGGRGRRSRSGSSGRTCAASASSGSSTRSSTCSRRSGTSPRRPTTGWCWSGSPRRSRPAGRSCSRRSTRSPSSRASRPRGWHELSDGTVMLEERAYDPRGGRFETTLDVRERLRAPASTASRTGPTPRPSSRTMAAGAGLEVERAVGRARRVGAREGLPPHRDARPPAGVNLSAGNAD